MNRKSLDDICVKDNSIKFHINMRISWISLIFGCSLAIGYVVMYLSYKGLNPNYDQPSLRWPTTADWIFATIVSIVIGCINQSAWNFRKVYKLSLFKRIIFGISAFVAIVCTAVLVVYISTHIWAMYTTTDEFGSAMKARILTGGILIAGLLIWFPLNLIAWAMPCKNRTLTGTHNVG
jgi:hypothetical protein